MTGKDGALADKVFTDPSVSVDFAARKAQGGGFACQVSCYRKCGWYNVPKRAFTFTKVRVRYW